MKKYIILSIIGLVGLSSCKKEGCTNPEATNYSAEAEKDDGSCQFENVITPPTSTLVDLGSATTSNNETVTIYAEEALTVGYSNIYAEVRDSNGDIMDNATVTFAPLMDMGAMQHACPVIQPTYNSATERYDGVVIFQMGSMGGTWTLDVVVDGNPASFTLNIGEAPTNTKPVGVYTGTDSEQYIVSVVRPENWEVGSQDLDIMIHRKETMMSFPAVVDFDVVLTPEMVSMGHGSTGNVDPVHVANGLYTGTVNLSMMGDWRLHLELSQGATVIHSDAYLDILF